MPKLSPAYREDDTENLPPAIREYLDVHFLRELDNLEVHNPKLVVVFSGGTALGKSTLSARIGTALHAVCLENDAVKTHLLKFDPQISKDNLNTLTWKYTIDLYSRLDDITTNGLIVRDGVIDWYYDRILPIFIQKGYALFIVEFDISKGRQIELIRARGDTPTTSADRLITILDDQAIHQKRFRNLYRPDVILTDESLFDHEIVIEKLRSRLKNLS